MGLIEAHLLACKLQGIAATVVIRNIKAGEEITYDYCLYDGGDDEATCNCGAKTCRGTMYSKEEIKRRKAAAAKARKKAAKKRRAPRKRQN